MALILIDTNLLVYAVDPSDQAKQEQALQVLAHLQGTGEGRLSAQSLAEFFNTAIRKLRPVLTTSEALARVEELARAFLVLDVTPLIVLEAARGVRDHMLAYYDAQIWATARLNQIPTIFSEDFNTGAILEGVRFVNPFSADFVLEAWA